jgi:hypothetical protein
LPDASVAHGLDGAAQDGKRVVLGKKPDFDVRKFLIQVVQRLASLGSADRVSRLRKFRLVCLCQSFARNGRCDTKAAGSEATLFTPLFTAARFFRPNRCAKFSINHCAAGANANRHRTLSALPPKADMCGAVRHVR